MIKHLTSAERKSMTKEQRRAYRLSVRRSALMQDAHKVAKLIANLVGNYSIALSFALKFVNAYNKEIDEARATKDMIKLGSMKQLEGAALDEFAPKSVAGVPAWALKKDFSKTGTTDILFFTIKAETIQETEKAVQISFDTKNPHENGFIDHHKAWVAKSILVA